MSPPAVRLVSIGGIVAGLLAVWGSSIAWLSIGSPIAFPGSSAPGEATGLDLPAGIFALAGGVALVAGAALGLSGRRRRLGGVVCSAGGLEAALGAAFVLMAPTERMTAFIISEAATTELPGDQISALVHGLVNNGTIHVALDAGVYVTLTAGLVGAALGVLLFRDEAPRSPGSGSAEPLREDEPSSASGRADVEGGLIEPDDGG